MELIILEMARPSRLKLCGVVKGMGENVLTKEILPAGALGAVRSNGSKVRFLSVSPSICPSV